MPIEVIHGKRVHLDESEGRHQYTLDGRPVPGCTSIIERAGYIDLSMVPEQTLRWKADLGSRVHLYTHYLDDNDLDWADLMDYPEYARRVEGWAQFKDDYGFEVVREWSERPTVVIWDGMQFGIKPDCIGYWRNGDPKKLIVVEKKCTAEIERAAHLQTAAQALLVKNLDNPSPRRMVVQLLDSPNRGGRYYNVVDCKDPSDERLFRSCLAIDIDKRNAHIIK